MRLFVAVNLPAAERRAAWEAVEPLRALDVPVRWVAEENLHVTLQFLGEVDSALAAPIGEALGEAVGAARPFDVTLGGFGAFPDLGAARVLWLGMERHPALELLANDVAGALRRFGFEPELKPFQPHLTIGRARRDAGGGVVRDLEVPAVLQEFAALVTVDAVDLMMSRTGPQGPSYRSVARALLGGGR